MGSKNPQAVPISVLIDLAFDVIKTRLQVQGSTLRYNGCYMQSSIRMADDAQEVAQR
ncbi:hypothetical protein ACE6H2_025301 [Prunus campanulata]